ncbi:uncharacterized protein EI97DRAFT_210777 [Westerdykella ornata]|uniref:Uncharacterized protein n=1 Tax=Westerdykella ornata TaxID=318751 RepID=A0A6A6J7B8_WESOR|nr:uncharacterized protein EI97DRAFT_210777 [Westerdykella ornata]KAF2272460.1 hypothetical protein EI97DRAFT_210777 [Westerdykella ornata]
MTCTGSWAGEYMGREGWGKKSMRDLLESVEVGYISVTLTDTNTMNQSTAAVAGYDYRREDCTAGQRYPPFHIAYKAHISILHLPQFRNFRLVQSVLYFSSPSPPVHSAVLYHHTNNRPSIPIVHRCPSYTVYLLDPWLRTPYKVHFSSIPLVSLAPESVPGAKPALQPCETLELWKLVVPYRTVLVEA